MLDPISKAKQIRINITLHDGSVRVIKRSTVAESVNGVRNALDSACRDGWDAYPNAREVEAIIYDSSEVNHDRRSLSLC